MKYLDAFIGCIVNVWRWIAAMRGVDGLVFGVCYMTVLYVIVYLVIGD